MKTEKDFDFDLFREDVIKKFPYKHLNFFKRENIDDLFEINVERKFIHKNIIKIDYETIVQEFVRQLTDKYVNKIKEKAHKREITLDYFKKQVYPQEVSIKDDLWFVCFNIPISFQEFYIEKNNKQIKIHAKLGIIDDLLKDNAMIKNVK